METKQFSTVVNLALSRAESYGLVRECYEKIWDTLTCHGHVTPGKKCRRDIVKLFSL